MTDTMRRVVKWVGYPLYAIVVFLTFIYLSLPYEKLKSRIEDQAAATGELELDIGELGPSPLLGLSAERVTITLKPQAPPVPMGTEEKPKPKAQRILLDEVTVKTGLFAILGGGVDLSFDVSGLGGEIAGSYQAEKKKGWSFQAEVSGLNLARIPLLEQAVGLPLAGKLSSKIDLTVPLNRWSNASGTVELECDACSIGDGKAKLKVPGNPLLAMGITLPRLRLGKLGGQIKIEKGTATLENVSAASPDIELAMEGKFLLQNPVGYSTAHAYLRFKISSELKKRDAKFELLENGLQSAKRPDGFFGMQMLGPLKRMRFIPSSLGPARGGESLPGGPGGLRAPGRRFAPGG